MIETGRYRVLADKLVLLIASSAFDDAQWQSFGFRGCPRGGWNVEFLLSKERRWYEQFLRKELMILGLSSAIDTLGDHPSRRVPQTFVAFMLEFIERIPTIDHVMGVRTPTEAVKAIRNGCAVYASVPLFGWPDVVVSRAPKLSRKQYVQGLLSGSRGLILSPNSIYNRVTEAVFDLLDRESEFLVSAADKCQVDEKAAAVAQHVLTALWQCRREATGQKETDPKGKSKVEEPLELDSLDLPRTLVNDVIKDERSKQVWRIFIKDPEHEAVQQNFWELSPEQVSKFVDSEGSAYCIVDYKEGIKQHYLVAKDLWMAAPGWHN